MGQAVRPRQRTAAAAAMIGTLAFGGRWRRRDPEWNTGTPVERRSIPRLHPGFGLAYCGRR